ncbi:MAG TPA: folylpolyglutamate synthase/dihydrofolate synthase family protein [Elusimicrobiota bacterium]|nr:folylpolyglutamate synthase/dihydrofolate synthase family protein [Elusimicrobiota bacterium]
MTYASALAALEARQEARIELGLDRVRKHLSLLGDPHERVPVFHVAGTNGKGSTCAILSSVLRASGRRVGLYVSPHLLDVRERISVDGRPISKDDFARFMSRALKADPKKRLTYFELLTSVAFQHFADRKCGVAVLETGLGGRLDATNVVTSPLAAIVTSIDYDHMSFLGKTLAAIAAQKAGIFKTGCPAVFPDLPVLRRSVKRGSPIVVRRPWKTIRTDWASGAQLLLSPRGDRFRLSLLGSKQGWNAALAHAAVAASGLEVSAAAWKKGLASVDWPARIQPIRLGRKTLVIDGAHNPEAARALAATFKASPWSKRPARWILGILRDKDEAGVLKPLAPFLRDVAVVRPPSPRALEPLEFAASVRRHAPRARVTVERDPAGAIAAWRRDARAPAVAVCAGSLYLAGAALKAAGRRA